MFPPEVADRLIALGHAARAAAVDLRGLTDQQLLDVAVAERRVVVTENAADFAALLQTRIAAGDPLAPVVFALKATLPARPGPLAARLAALLDAWAADHPEPVATAYWL